MIKKIFPLVFIFAAAFSIGAQTYEKIADDSFGYVKYGTFGKPSVVKKTQKLALAQVRVHYKFISTEAVENRKNNNSARVSVYLDGAMTDADLQNLTNEFYAILQRKLGALGIEFVDWEAIKTTEYYQNRQAAAEDKKNIDGDLENGQAWVSFTAFDGPVFYRYNPGNPMKNEVIAFGKAKKISGMSEALGAEIAMFDVLIDFSTINLQTNLRTVWKEDGEYINYQANQQVTALMSVPQSNAVLQDRKNVYDIYVGKLPIAVRYNFANRLYEDPNKAALKVRRFFGDGGNTRFTFTPVVVEADRQLYLNAARRVLEQYADLFAEKMRQIRAGEKPSKSAEKQTPASNPADNKTVAEVKEEARRNNQTTPVTFLENLDAAKQAAAEKKWNLAVGFYGEAIKIRPDNFQPYFERGLIYFNHLQNYKAAVADFNKSLELNPQEIAALYNRGSAYLQLQEFKKAHKDLDAFIAQKPDMFEAYLNRGIVLLNMKKTDEALADFETGIRLNPRFPNLYRARALAYKVKGNAAAAQADELRAAQLERGQ